MTNIKSRLPHMRHIAIYLLLPVLCACGGNGQEQNNTANGNVPDTIPVFILRGDTVKKTIELPAELIPYESAELFAKVQGFIREMKVDLGDRVKKGQVLAVIEAPEVNSRFAESEASVQSARAKWMSSKDQYERLYRASQAPTPGIVAPADLERNRNQMLADSAAYAAAGKQAQSYKAISGYLYIISPFDGVITARKADPGAITGPGAQLLTVQNNHVLRLRVAVPEVYVAAAVSKEIDFRVDAYPTQYFKAMLARKSETIDPATRTELWEFRVDNSGHQLKAGAFAYVKLKLERGAPSFTVPFSSIATTQERKFVIQVKDGKAAWTDVRQGITTDSAVEVFGNLKAGDTLLVKATDERKPGSTGFWKLKARS